MKNWSPTTPKMSASSLSGRMAINLPPLLTYLQYPVYLGQLRDTNRILDFRHAVVETDARHPQGCTVNITEGFQLPHLLGKNLVVRGNRSAFSQAGHVLVALETVTGRLSPVTHRFTPVSGADSVGSIVYDRDTGLFRYPVKAVYVAGKPGEMYGYDCLCAGRDFFHDGGRVKVHRDRVYVGKNNLCSPCNRCARGAHEGQGRRYDLVALPDTQGHHAAVKSSPAGIDRHRPARALMLGQHILELRLLRQGEKTSRLFGNRGNHANGGSNIVLFINSAHGNERNLSYLHLSFSRCCSFRAN